MKAALALCTSLLVTPAVADPVVVFAAASLKEPLDMLAATGDVVVSYGGSGALARQVSLGAPADIILLANDAWMQNLVTAGIVTDVADFASNALVLIGPPDAPDIDIGALPSLLADSKLAMGFFNAVPAGIYGRAAFENLGVWDAIAPNVVAVDNVRAALALVARKEAAFGVTYATDARATRDVRIVANFDPADHPVIRYTGARVSDNPDALAFWALLRGPQGQAALAGFGFLPPVPQ